MQRRRHWFLASLLGLVAFVASACATTAPAEVAPYTPSFRYDCEQAQSKSDVTVALVAPQFSGDGLDYWQGNRTDPVVSEMVRAMRTSFESLLVNKGFNVSGPFESVDDMTFPEKKGCDFVLYPEIDVREGYDITNLRQETHNNLLTGVQVVAACDFKMRPSGSIVIVAKEPL